MTPFQSRGTLAVAGFPPSQDFPTPPMSLLQVDVLLRVAAGALWLMLSLLLLAQARRHRSAVLLALLGVGFAGFLAGNTPHASLMPSGGFATIAGLLSGSAAVVLWWFCLAVFDDEFRPGALTGGIAALWLGLVLLDRGVLGAQFADRGLSWGLVSLATAMALHVAFRWWQDARDDLVEARRAARRRVAGALIALLVVDLGADLAMGFDWKPAWFAMAQNATLLVLAAGLMSWLVRLDADALGFRARTGTPQAPPDAEPAATRDDSDPVLGALEARLRDLMLGQHLYRDSGLDFAGFVRRMGGTEPEVRRLINQRLGHRHFRSFLNHYRVADACRALADPAREGEKLVGIAFDSGFGSLASFNRVFGLAMGCSPSEYRERARRSDGEPAPSPALPVGA